MANPEIISIPLSMMENNNVVIDWSSSWLPVLLDKIVSISPPLYYRTEKIVIVRFFEEAMVCGSHHSLLGALTFLVNHYSINAINICKVIPDTIGITVFSFSTDFISIKFFIEFFLIFLQ